MKQFTGNRRLLPVLVATSGIAYLVSQVIIFKILEPLGESVARFQFSFDSAGIAGIIAGWGDAGRARFLCHFYPDFPHPLLYSSFMFFLLCLLKSNMPGNTGPGRIPLYFFLPFAAAFLDIIENILELAIIFQRADIPAWLAIMNGTVSSAKWGAAAISLGIIATHAVMLLFAVIRDRGHISP